MIAIFEAVRKALKRDNSITYDAENVSKALVSAHHYLHHVLYAGNSSGAGKPFANHAVPVSDGEPSTQKKTSN